MAIVRQELRSSAPARRVLIVDDSLLQRRIVFASLKRRGYRVMEAASGPEALEICQRESPDIVISDWMMPGMSGPEFCQAFRAMDRGNYGYFILLTSKSESCDIAQGLDAGADDFLTKPISGNELRARLTAGERILKMQEELVDKNALLSGTLAELQSLYDAIDTDLAEARKLQQSLVKSRYRDFGPATISLLLRPSGHVGGDLVGFFPIDAVRVAMYAIDVSGHGVASALMAARLSGYISGESPEQNLALLENEFGIRDVRAPEAVAELLNTLILTEMETETYSTLLFADVDLVSGAVRLVQAGHPHPVVQRADGSVEIVGAGGLPIGLVQGASYERYETRLCPGDRLCVVSDGVTECETPDGELFEQDGLRSFMEQNRGLTGPTLLDAMSEELMLHAKSTDFTDDVSAILFEFAACRNGRQLSP